MLQDHFSMPECSEGRACVRVCACERCNVRTAHARCRAFSCASKNHVDQILPSVKLNIFIDFDEKNLTVEKFAADSALARRNKKMFKMTKHNEK